VDSIDLENQIEYIGLSKEKINREFSHAFPFLENVLSALFQRVRMLPTVDSSSFILLA
jgi:hypothetical protein